LSVTAIALLTFGARQLNFGISSSGFVYLLAVLVVALVWGFPMATFTSFVAVACLDFFFVPPTFSFNAADRNDWVALGVFETTALLASRFTAREQRHMREKLQQQQSIEKLYKLSQSTLLMDLHQPAGTQIVRLIHDIFRMEAVALCDGSTGIMNTVGVCTEIDEEMAQAACQLGETIPADPPGVTRHTLLLRDHAVAGLVLRGKLAPGVASALASLTAIALDRYSSFEKESLAVAAHQSEGLRAAVLDALAHAFKTPLTVIRAASSGLLETDELGQRQREMATMIDEQSTHLNELATRLLQTARLESKEIEMKKENVVISALIDSVLQEQQDYFTGHRVEVDVADASMATHGDPGLIATIISQFVDNATKYSKPGTPISIEAKQSNAVILISVHNEGSPIPIEDRDRIFERFYRGSASGKQIAGSGLGLSIAKRAADAHNGHVWVTSAEEAGTTFYLSLPQQ
jgi:two-component system sensor histidine kinase KdpD